MINPIYAILAGIIAFTQARAEVLTPSTDCREEILKLSSSAGDKYVSLAKTCQKEYKRIDNAAADLFGREDSHRDFRICADDRSCFASDCEATDKKDPNFRRPTRPFVMFAKTAKAKGTILFVHGLTDSPYSFGKVAEQMAGEGYNIVAILLSGHGESQRTQVGKKFVENWRSDVEDGVIFAKRLFGEKNFSIGGFSTGGLLTADFFQRHPSECKKRGVSQILFDPALHLGSRNNSFLKRQQGAGWEGLVQGSMRFMVNIYNSIMESTNEHNPSRIPIRGVSNYTKGVYELSRQFRNSEFPESCKDLPTYTVFTNGVGGRGFGIQTIDPVESKKRLEQRFENAVVLEFSDIRHSQVTHDSHHANCAPGGERGRFNKHFTVEMAVLKAFAKAVRGEGGSVKDLAANPLNY